MTGVLEGAVARKFQPSIPLLRDMAQETTLCRSAVRTVWETVRTADPTS
jgi:hypothetical protein